jgi:hypothetical protein
MNITRHRSIWLWPIILLLSTTLASFLVFSDISASVRYILVFWFLLVCPGMAYVRLLDIEDKMIEWTLAIALSLGIDTFVSLALLYSGNWSTNRVMVILVAFTFGGIVLQIWRLRPIQTRRSFEKSRGSPP